MAVRSKINNSKIVMSGSQKGMGITIFPLVNDNEIPKEFPRFVEVASLIK